MLSVFISYFLWYSIREFPIQISCPSGITGKFVAKILNFVILTAKKAVDLPFTPFTLC